MSRIPSSTVLVAIGLAALALAAGCSDGGGSASATGTAGATTATLASEATTTSAVTAPESQSDSLDGCATKKDGHIIEMHVAGETLDGIVVGKGDVGVVLAHQKDSDLCAWLPYARHLNRLGFRSLAFDFKTYAVDLVESVRAAADELHRRGARRIILIGASMGGTAVLDAATRIPTVAGVVSASGPATYGDANASRAIRSLHVPLLFIVARDDEDFVPDARRLFQQASSPEKRLEILPGFTHGNGFFAAPVAGRAVRLVDDFIEDVVKDPE